MPTPHKVVGWSLVTAFTVLLLLAPTQITWRDWSSALVIIPIAAILAGFILIPGIMVLQKRWAELASVLSGLVCIALFIFFISHLHDLLKHFEPKDNRLSWLPFLGLVVLIAAWTLPFRLHKILKPRLERLMTSQKNSP